VKTLSFGPAFALALALAASGAFAATPPPAKPAVPQKSSAPAPSNDPVQSTAPPPGGDTGASNLGGFSHIRTDKVQFNINNGDFTIPDKFTATRPGSDITADHATGNSKQKQLHAEGHVVVNQTSAATGTKNTNDLSQRPSRLTCDRLDVDGIKKIYYATGNMHFTQEGGREATSDNAVLDDANHHLHLEGHAHVRKDDQVIDADTLDYDTASGELEANGDVTITAPYQTAPPGAAASAAPKKKRHGGLPF
jgi:lipopolysaccharide export system protein LptA